MLMAGPAALVELFEPVRQRLDVRRRRAVLDVEPKAGRRDVRGHVGTPGERREFSQTLRVRPGPPRAFTPSSDGNGMIAGRLEKLEETMALRILSGGAIAALAGAAMLAAASGPSDAFTLNSPSLEAPVAAAGIEPVYWRHWGWRERLASRMGLASRLGLAWRLASLGLGPAPGVWSALGLGLWRRLALLVDPVGLPSLRLGLT